MTSQSWEAGLAVWPLPLPSSPPGAQAGSQLHGRHRCLGPQVFGQHCQATLLSDQLVLLAHIASRRCPMRCRPELRVAVFERSTLRPRGASLGLQPNGLLPEQSQGCAVAPRPGPPSPCSDRANLALPGMPLHGGSTTRGCQPRAEQALCQLGSECPPLSAGVRALGAISPGLEAAVCRLDSQPGIRRWAAVAASPAPAWRLQHAIAVSHVAATSRPKPRVGWS